MQYICCPTHSCAWASFNLSVSLFSLSRLSCWVVMDRTWWQEVITGSWRCGRPVTSNSFTSTQAVMQASEPWTSHMTRGKVDRDRQCDNLSQTPGCLSQVGGTLVTLKGTAEKFSQTPNYVPTLENIRWNVICTNTVWQSVCSALRTLITGMASGSIVAFNIDFNRWHYEHQNRYWGGQHEEEEERRTRGRGGDSFCCVSATQGKLQAPRGRKHLPDLRLYSLVYLMWGRGSQRWWDKLPPFTRV